MGHCGSPRRSVKRPPVEGSSRGPTSRTSTSQELLQGETLNTAAVGVCHWAKQRGRIRFFEVQRTEKHPGVNAGLYEVVALTQSPKASTGTGQENHPSLFQGPFFMPHSSSSSKNTCQNNIYKINLGRWYSFLWAFRLLGSYCQCLLLRTRRVR